MDDGYMDNNGTIDECEVSDGTLVNEGQINELTMTGGTLDNAGGYIETLYYSSGYIQHEGNIGEIIYVDAAAAGTIDEGYVDEGMVAAPIITLDNGDWQDAAPLGEEVMVW